MSQVDEWVSFDVDHIQEFVFASNRPLDVQGASELVKDLNDHTLQKWLGPTAAVIYVNGGTGLLRVSPGKGADACRTIEDQFRRMTVSGSCTAVSVAPQGDMHTPAIFQAALRELGSRLILRKAEKAAEQPPEAWAMGYFERCKACGQYPAQEEDRGQHICAACLARRGRYKQARNAGTDTAESLADIVGAGTPDAERFLAVIYGDANRAGDLLTLANNESELKAFSNHLWEGTIQQAVAETVASCKLSRRYQSPVVGGDDVLLLVPAPQATGVLVTLADKLREQLAVLPRQLQNTAIGKALQALTFSFALLLVPHRMPIPYILQYARRLLSSAKSRAYRDPAAPTDAVDLWWIRGGSDLSTDLQALRKESARMSGRTQFPTGGAREWVEAVELTTLPCTLDWFKTLLGRANAVDTASVPPSQLHGLERILSTSEPTTAWLQLLRQTARSDVLRSWLAKCGFAKKDQWADFYFQTESRRGRYVVSPLRDIAELHEMQHL